MWEETKWTKVNKETVQKATAGMDCLLTRAMKVKDKEVILKPIELTSNEGDSNINILISSPSTWRTIGTECSSVYKQHSAKELVDTNGWVDHVKQELCCVDFCEPTENVMKQADSLTKHLSVQVRLDNHIKNCLPEKLWSDWSFRWARK